MSDKALLGKMAWRWSSRSEFLEHLAARPLNSWLLPLDSAERFSEILSCQYPDCVPSLIGAADDACDGKFDLFGHQVQYTNGMDWQRDPMSDWRWPVSYRERLDSLIWSPDPPADLTFSWELNRHQHFSYLGAAYWLTRDERYALAFICHVKSWIEQNPFQHGIHWHTSLEVALRAIAWTLGFQWFRNSSHVTESFKADFLKCLYQQLDFVLRHLQNQRSAVPNNHLLAELAAILIVGAVFPEFKEAVSWRKTGTELLLIHLAQQTHLDGVNKEQATGYHRFVVELLLVLVSLGRRGLLPRAHVLEETLEKMLDYLLYSTDPDGRLATWGDCGYVRALGMEPGEDYGDARWLLAAGAVLFQRADWKNFASSFGIQAYLLLGAEGLQVWERLPAGMPKQTSRAFPDGGVYILRESWDPQGDLMIFRCGPFGLGEAGKCSHAHCDLLSPQLWVRGRQILADPGTYTYSGPWRDQFRLTSAHNTLVVDGHEQAEPLSPFGWRRIPQAVCLEWVAGHQVTGSLITAPGALHRRRIEHLSSGIWQICDHLEGNGSHHLAWNFHFSPGLSLRWLADCRELAVEESNRLFVLIRPPVGITIWIKPGWHSRGYGFKELSHSIEGLWRGSFAGGQIEFTWEFVSVRDRDRGEAT
jgi:hypothetical protein